MKKHFVTFCSPGTFFAEQTTQEIGEWDVREAMRLAGEIRERHGARPYGFYFSTAERGANDWEPKTTKRGPMHFINGKAETLAEVEARNDPSEHILRSNMRCNQWGAIVTTNNGYRWTQPFVGADVCVNADGEIIARAIDLATPEPTP